MLDIIICTVEFIHDIAILSLFINHFKDFEDWDDVGLNVPKPPPLLILYRDFIHQSHFVSLVDVSTQVDLQSDKPPVSLTANVIR